MAEQVAREQRRQGQEGNRWVNQLPSGKDISDWFEKNVKIGEGLDHKEYVGGVTLIPNEEKSKAVVGWDGGNNPIIRRVEDLVYTPYMRVETRIKYFWDLMAEAETIGFIEPVPTEKPDPSVPPGFFKMVIPTGENVGVRFICCSMRVTVYEKDSVTYEKLLVDKRTGREEIVRRGKILLAGAPATKMVPTLSYDKADNNSIMKAETGAIGRALGMAGMLVIPGTGIATAEDMQELGQTGGATVSEAADGAELPEGPLVVEQRSDADLDQEMRDEVGTILKAMEQFPETLASFKAWAAQRGHNRLSEVVSPALRGMHRKAKAMLEEAAVTSEQEAPQEKPAAKPKPAKPAAKAKAKAKAKPPAKADTPPPGPLS